ncbi:hypothetical protein EVAR_41745_1 [Eumeta japonica]|uniref:Uncharacterized protein n=1 Tax=Eumeta variegata TaxID=151549 RepID=A0A4C1W058_EUMVA|nr:hypothetical protein EVAR_41745_1 [Eumeta japonica]
MRVGSRQWRCDRCVLCVKCLGKIDAETVRSESGVKEDVTIKSGKSPACDYIIQLHSLGRPATAVLAVVDLL